MEILQLLCGIVDDFLPAVDIRRHLGLSFPAGKHLQCLFQHRLHPVSHLRGLLHRPGTEFLLGFLQGLGQLTQVLAVIPDPLHIADDMVHRAQGLPVIILQIQAVDFYQIFRDPPV